MNVTRLQQPPLQTGSARSALEAEETTPDVRSLLPATFRSLCSDPMYLVLVNKTSQ
jgi:hypothetical protein